MAARISLALAIHNHQPVGNFGWVFAEVYDQAYLPMLEALERHPGVRLSLHYTGPLLEWLGGGAAGLPGPPRRRSWRATRWSSWAAACTSRSSRRCPRRDRVDQLTRMASTIAGITGRRAAGRVAGRARLGARPADGAGRGRLPLDDPRRPALPRRRDPRGEPVGRVHDRGPGPPADGLRDRAGPALPDPVRRPSSDVIDYLRDHATEDGKRVGMMGDDGEKFGAWPTTYEHCWGEGRWVERFFEALEANRDWLTTVTPSQWLEREPPIGRVYVPTSSYAEMGEWALPPDETVVFTGLLHDAVAPARPGGALAARRVLAQLPGEVPRDQRPPQADAPGVRQGRRRCPRARSATRRSTTSTAASRTTATGTACSAASTSATCGSRRTST